MAIAHKETVSNDIGSTTTPDLTNISSPASGDFLLAGVVTDSAHTVLTPPSSWTQVVLAQEDSAGDTCLSVYYIFAGGSEPATYTDWLTFGASEGGVGFVSAWTGVDQTTPMDTTPLSEGSTSGTAKDTPAITPVTSGAMLVGILGADPGAARSFTWDGGIDPRLDTTVGTTGYVTIGSKTWGGSGAESLGGDLNSAEPMAELIVALRPAVEGTVVTATVASSTADVTAPPRPRPDWPFAEVNVRM